MAGKKGTKNFTEKEFKQVKTLQGVGLSQAQARKITGRSNNTVWHSFNSKNFTEYKNRTKTRRKSKTGVSGSTFVVRPQEDVQLIIDHLRALDAKVTAVLERMDAKEASEKVNGWRFGRSR
jgi:hypothetical protein